MIFPVYSCQGNLVAWDTEKKNEKKKFVRNDTVQNWDDCVFLLILIFFGTGKQQRHYFSLLQILACPLHSSLYMDFKVHILRDITYSTCIKSMKTKPVITLIFLSSLRVHIKKLVGAQSSLQSYTHSLWGTTRFSPVWVLPPLVWCQAGTWSPRTETAFWLCNCNEILTEKQGTGTGQQFKWSILHTY